MEHKMLSLGLMSSRLDYIRLDTSDWDIRIGEGRHLLIQPNFIGSLLPNRQGLIKTIKPPCGWVADISHHTCSSFPEPQSFIFNALLTLRSV